MMGMYVAVCKHLGETSFKLGFRSVVRVACGVPRVLLFSSLCILRCIGVYSRDTSFLVGVRCETGVQVLWYPKCFSVVLPVCIGA